MTTEHELDDRIRDMLTERATDVPDGLVIPSHHDLDARRLARSADSVRASVIRRGWRIGAVAAAAVVAVAAVAIASDDDKRTTTIVDVPSSTRTVAPASTATPATPPVTRAFNDFPPKSSLAPGQPCPLTLRPDGVIGHGNVALMLYLGRSGSGQVVARPDPTTGLGEIPIFWFAAPEQPGGILVRGYQLDGDDIMQFNTYRGTSSGFPDLSPEVVVTFSQNFSFGGLPAGWRHEPDIWLFVKSSGCYAIDIEGTGGFREQLVIDVVRT